jgi:hypothetical protein
MSEVKRVNIETQQRLAERDSKLDNVNEKTDMMKTLTQSLLTKARSSDPVANPGRRRALPLQEDGGHRRRGRGAGRLGSASWCCTSCWSAFAAAKTSCGRSSVSRNNAAALIKNNYRPCA